MAIDKAKIEQIALKYAQRGQFHKAIAEYQKIIAAEPKDTRIRIKLLDLFGKVGQKAAAVDECRRISDSYVEQGFIPRAIAVWKQAIRIDPDNPVIYKNMGELYLHQKLTGDAITSFKKSVDLLRQGGKLIEAGELLQKMEQLAPDNVAIKVHLAELYLDELRTDDFRTELEKIVVQLKGEGRSRKLLNTLVGLYDRSGRRPEVVKPLAETYLELGEDEEALEVVRSGLSQLPQDRDLRLISIRANLALGNITDARKVAMGIREETPDDLFILEQLAAIAKARNDNDELVQWYKETAKVYARQGLAAREEYYYNKVLELVPDDAEARLSVGNLETPMQPARGEQVPEPPRAAPQGAGMDDFFLDFGAIPAPSEQAGLVSAATPIEEGIIEADLYLKYGLDEKAHQKLLELQRAVPDNHIVRGRLRDLCWKRGDRDGWLKEQMTIARGMIDAGKPSEALRAYEAVLDVMPENHDARMAIDSLRGETDRGAAPSMYAMLDDELERIDAMIRNSESGEAVSALLRLQEQFPASSEISTRLVDLGWVSSGGVAAEVEDEFADIKAELGELDFGMQGSIAGFEEVEVSELDDILKEFKSGVAEKLDEADFQTHYDLGVAYKEMGLLEEALQEFQKASRFTEKAKNAYTSMAMIYREVGRFADARASLRMALAVPTNTPEDRAAILFELGVVAEDEGDWEGAAHSYEKAAAIDPAHRDLPQRLANAKARMH